MIQEDFVEADMIANLCADLLREIVKLLLGVELPVALTNKLMLRVASS